MTPESFDSTTQIEPFFAIISFFAPHLKVADVLCMSVDLLTVAFYIRNITQ